MPPHHTMKPETWWSQSSSLSQAMLPASQGLSLQVTATASCRHPHSISRSPLVLFSWLNPSASGATFLTSPLLHPNPSQINNLLPITSSPLVLVLLQPHLTVAISDAINPALHGVTGWNTNCRQPGSPQLPHSCPIRLSLPPAVIRHNYSPLALIPVQAAQALAGPYLSVYILEAAAGAFACHSSASTARALALWGCMLQQDTLLTSHPLVCWSPPRTDRQTTPDADKHNPFQLEATTTVKAGNARKVFNWAHEHIPPFWNKQGIYRIKNNMTSIITNNKYRIKCIKCCIAVVQD